MAKRNTGTQITMSGTVLFACLVAFWIYCAASRVFNPSGALGVFLGDIEGIVAIAIGSVLLAGIAGVILEKLGFPITEPNSGDAK